MTSLGYTGLNKISQEFFVYWHKLRRDSLLINVRSHITVSVFRQFAAVLLCKLAKLQQAQHDMPDS